MYYPNSTNANTRLVGDEIVFVLLIVGKRVLATGKLRYNNILYI